LKAGSLSKLSGDICGVSFHIWPRAQEARLKSCKEGYVEHCASSEFVLHVRRAVRLRSDDRSAFAHDNGRDVLVITSTNNASGNDVVVFRLDTTGTPSLPLLNVLPTGGSGGAGGNAGSVQFRDEFGAVANYGSSNITRLLRKANSIAIGQNIALAAGCANPVSISLTDSHLYIAGANCAESRRWPSGIADAF
jgi:hypothetical protein